MKTKWRISKVWSARWTIVTVHESICQSLWGDNTILLLTVCCWWYHTKATSFQVNRLEAYRVDELPRPSPALPPVDTTKLHSVIELDRTGITYLEMYSAVGQRPQVDVQYSIDVRCLVPNSSIQPVIKSAVFMVWRFVQWQQWCYYNTDMTLPEITLDVTNYHSDHDMYVSASIHHRCRLNPC